MPDPLKPCPFCGGEAALNSDYDGLVVCVACESEGPWKESADAAVAAWNRRSKPDPSIALAVNREDAFDALLAELKRLEWSRYDGQSYPFVCPSCSRSKPSHAINCALAAALAAVESPPV